MLPITPNSKILQSAREWGLYLTEPKMRGPFAIELERSRGSILPVSPSRSTRLTSNGRKDQLCRAE